MRYEIDGRQFRTENVAKPITQASKYLTQWIETHEQVEHGLDYGCGKLRYAGSMARTCQVLTLVDSEIQLNRTQKIGDQITTVRSYAVHSWPHVRLLTIKEFLRNSTEYDFILCANVLSAIPLEDVRSTVLSSLRTALKQHGTCLLVAQYTNSYYTKIRDSPNAKPHLDGYIVTSRRGNSYFGILKKSKLEQLARDHGFAVLASWTAGQSAYILASQQDVSPSGEKKADHN